MLLLDLPVEILTCILRYVGRWNLERQMTVCRQWYEIGQPITLENISVYTTSTNLLGWFPPGLGRIPRLIEENVRCLYIASDGWPAYADDGPEWPEWSRDLNLGLAELAGCIPSMKRLAAFELGASEDLNIDTPIRHKLHYLQPGPMKALITALSHARITRLNIDTHGTALAVNEDAETGAAEYHLCPLLIRDFPHLRFLKLRMRWICPAIFEFAGRQSHSSLSTVIINLSLMVHPSAKIAGLARHCDTSRILWGSALHTAMVNAACSATASLPKIKVLRILCHRVPSLELVAKDCLSGNSLLVPADDWESTGTEVDCNGAL